MVIILYLIWWILNYGDDCIIVYVFWFLLRIWQCDFYCIPPTKLRHLSYIGLIELFAMFFCNDCEFWIVNFELSTSYKLCSW